MKRTWLRFSTAAVLSAAGWIAAVPQVAQAQAIAIGAGVWGWRNVVAPRFGGPVIAPDVRFRPLGGLVADGLNRAIPGPGSQAYFDVRMPDSDGQVWIQDYLTQEKGRQRHFVSPPLQLGFEYVYEIRARWRDNEQTTDQTRTITVRSGQRIVVDFTRPVGE